MYSVWTEVALGIVIAWVAILTILIWKQASFFNKLFPKDTSGSVKDKLEEVLEEIEDFRKREKVLIKNIKDQSIDGLNHIQKVEMIRYNPYEDTGGSMSFSVVLIDGKMNGVLITSLHSRAGSRLYTKKIENGKSDLELSKEEKQVLEKVINEE